MFSGARTDTASALDRLLEDERWHVALARALLQRIEVPDRVPERRATAIGRMAMLDGVRAEPRSTFRPLDEVGLDADRRGLQPRYSAQGAPRRSAHTLV